MLYKCKDCGNEIFIIEDGFTIERGSLYAVSLKNVTKIATCACCDQKYTINGVEFKKVRRKE